MNLLAIHCFAFIPAVVTFLPFTLSVVLLFITLVLLLAVSAMMSGSETALFSLSPANMAVIKKRQNSSDNAIMSLIADQDYMLATILIVNNLVNICIILLANRIIDVLVVIGSPTLMFVIKTVIVTFLLLLFGEIMPKIYSAYNPLGFARMVARPLSVLRRAFHPFSWILIHSGSFISNALSRKKERISIDELSNAIEITQDQSEEERQMLSGIVNFVNTDVEQIMKPRMDIVALDVKDGYERVREVIISSGFSRIPVYEESLDNIKGILYVKDIIGYIAMQDGFGWQKLLRKPYFVPGHKKINDLLEEFRSTQVHIAVVVDEYGSTLGIVSLEDILEEIVGEIIDESDMDNIAVYEKLAEGVYLFDGKTHINDLLKVLDKPDDYLDQERGEAETVAGLMLEVKRDFLRKDETIQIHGISFTAKAILGRRIEKVKVVSLE